MASPVTGWHCHRASGATALIVPGAGAEQTRPGRRELRGPGAGDSGMPARRGAHRGKPCPPSVSPPGERVRDPKGSSRQGTRGHRSPPFPPRRIQRVRAELVPPAPSPWGPRRAPLTRSAGPGTGSWWRRGQRRATAAAEPACRGERSRGQRRQRRPRSGPCAHPALPPRRFHSPGGDSEPRGRCLPCAAAPRSTPGCPGGCSGRGCRPGVPRWVMEELVPALGPGVFSLGWRGHGVLLGCGS